MKYILAAAAALLTAMNQPSMAYPAGNVYGQTSTPYGQPWGQSRQEQEIHNLQQEVYNLEDQRMKNCVNSSSTYCGWDKGGW